MKYQALTISDVHEDLIKVQCYTSRMINFFLEKQKILSKIMCFSSPWLKLLWKLHLQLTQKDLRRGVSVSYLVPLQGYLHRVVSHPQTTGFIYSVDDRAATEQLAKDTDLSHQFPAAEMSLPSRGWGMVTAHELPPLSLEHELALPKSSSHGPGACPTHRSLVGGGKRWPGAHRLGSRGDLILQGCLWSLETPPQPHSS